MSLEGLFLMDKVKLKRNLGVLVPGFFFVLEMPNSNIRKINIWSLVMSADRKTMRQSWAAVGIF